MHCVTVMLGRRDTIEEITLQVGKAELHACLGVPHGPIGLAIFAHSSGSGRTLPRNRYVADALRARGIATLNVDLLTESEEQADRLDARTRFDVELLAERLLAATDWARDQASVSHLPLGYVAASTAAAAGLIAAAKRPEIVRAVVLRSGRADLAGGALPLVRAPTLLVVGGEDRHVLELSREAIARMTVATQLAEVPGASHLFEEPGTLDEVAQLAAEWLIDHFAGAFVGGVAGVAGGWTRQLADRRAAGQRLAGALRHLGDGVVVCGLPRGGVVVADEIAKTLGAALDVWLVRKIGMPIQPELGMGAIAEGAALVMDAALVKWSGASAREVRALVHRKAAEIRRRAKVYREVAAGEAAAAAPAGVEVRGKTVVLVDEGVTTGSVLALRAAIRGARRRGAARVVVATPVAAAEAVAELRKEADEVVALYEPEHVIAVAAWYQAFRQVADAEVLHVLGEARRREAERQKEKEKKDKDHRITA